MLHWTTFLFCEIVDSHFPHVAMDISYLRWMIEGARENGDKREEQNKYTNNMQTMKNKQCKTLLQGFALCPANNLPGPIIYRSARQK